MRFNRQNLRVGIALFFSLVSLAFLYQNCSKGFVATEAEEALTQLQSSKVTCSLEIEGKTESRDAGFQLTGFAENSVQFPAVCFKVTATCKDDGQWDKEIPRFQNCSQQCLNPSTFALEACPASVTIPKPVTNLPNWRRSMKVWEWRKLEGTDLSLVKPNTMVAGQLSGRLEGSHGLAADLLTSKIYSAANGGADLYAGNEVYELDMATDNPKWRLLREPTPAEFIFTGDPANMVFNDHYKDKRPSASRSYYSLQFISTKQQILKFGSGGLWGLDSGGSLKTDAYSVPHNDWLAPATLPDISAARESMKGVSVCKHPITEEVYIYLDRIRKFNPATNSFIALAQPPEGQQADDDADGGCAVDIKRKKILFFKNKYQPDDGAILYDIATDSLKPVTLKGPALRDVRDAVGGYGYYDATFDVFIFKDHKAGGRIFRIHPETFEVHQILTSGGAEMPEATGGVYTRFVQLPFLKGYLFYPKYGSDVWFLASE